MHVATVGMLHVYYSTGCKPALGLYLYMISTVLTHETIESYKDDIYEDDDCWRQDDTVDPIHVHLTFYPYMISMVLTHETIESYKDDINEDDECWRYHQDDTVDRIHVHLTIYSSSNISIPESMK
jgi:hypothetical protein